MGRPPRGVVQDCLHTPEGVPGTDIKTCFKIGLVDLKEGFIQQKHPFNWETEGEEEDGEGCEDTNIKHWSEFGHH